VQLNRNFSTEIGCGHDTSEKKPTILLCCFLLSEFIKCRKGMIKLLLTKEVEVTWGSNKNIYEPKGYIFTKKGDKLTVKIEDLALGSNIKVSVQCDYCLDEGIETISPVVYVNYIRSLKNSNLVNKDACSKCASKKSSEITLAKYNVNNVFCLPEIKKKISDTNLIKYGVSSVLKKSSPIRAKINQANMIRYGFTHYMQTEEFTKKRYGENNGNWKGGITTEINKLRGSIEYKHWRKSVFERDNYTCQVCGIRGGKLQAHHIKNFSDNLELRFDIDNGITICKEHHSSAKWSFHHIFGKKNNTIKQLEQYIKYINSNNSLGGNDIGDLPEFIPLAE